MVTNRLASTPLQLLAEVLSDTASTAAELAEAFIAQLEADDIARVARVVATMTDCPVTRRSRTLTNLCTR